MSKDKFQSSFNKKLPGQKPEILDIESEETFPSFFSASSPDAASSKPRSVPEDFAQLTYATNPENPENQVDETEIVDSGDTLGQGWIVLKSDPRRTRKLRNTPLKTNEQKWQEYLEGLSPYEYHKLASEKFDEMIQVNQRQDAEFIAMYGYDFYVQTYYNRDKVAYEEDSFNEEEVMEDYLEEDCDDGGEFF